MASNPPGKCCFKGFYHEGEPKGSFQRVYGLDTYVAQGDTQQPNRVIVVLTDVYGNKLNNVKLIADQLAKGACARVLVPDILKGDEITDLSGNVDFPKWLQGHTPDITEPIVNGFMEQLHAECNPGAQIGVVGYCFGAKFAVQLLDPAHKAGATVGAIAHPSFVSLEELAAIGAHRPLLVSAAETDQIFTPELRHSSEEKLNEIGAMYQLDLFAGTQHGFAARGDVSDRRVKYAKEKALLDQIHWFNHFFK
ncbi:protein AIM2 KNAG_0E00220 [Huiozyma naganishii CBS 8797]|uniref:Dienelactone hydrolase domain-containing protein n=1 Tax=Huiozyma naganishii (strain ATCC MYA-139 / BCRC 22969 / CBS 8797 / KCTC 17520 / NBRC 10181 / NCYC 3082 / Yp74L-3) TaxID=1071383 RepID=J7R603_HUIN7|nr:hypothetical protein KNAG_0E00220 [Kazachstania naganishii CBS 8797]CCK70290.1 hypothetical protein KNAG_0E00220 [Kazachstania naganishii CBS 8797]